MLATYTSNSRGERAAECAALIGAGAYIERTVNWSAESDAGRSTTLNHVQKSFGLANCGGSYDMSKYLTHAADSAYTVVQP